MTGSWFDSYTLKARWSPAAFAALPILALGASAFELDVLVGLAGPATAFLIFGLIASEIARSRGRLLELRLANDWGGLPTTRALRATSAPNEKSRTRRRDQILVLTGHALPTVQEQLSDRVGSDKAIERAVRVAIARLRQDGAPGANLLQSENASYGFRRNLTGLRPFGLTLALVGLASAFVLAVTGIITWSLLFPVLLLQGAVLVIWLVVPSRGWVKDQAEIYADRFFDVLDAHSSKAADG